jgi:hypothetical protein
MGPLWLGFLPPGRHIPRDPVLAQQPIHPDERARSFILHNSSFLPAALEFAAEGRTDTCGLLG